MRKKITSVVVKSHAFLLDPIKLATGRKEKKYTPPVNNVNLGLFSQKILSPDSWLHEMG